MNEAISAKNTMADIPSSSASAGTKMFPMKLFSSWEVEKSSPHCIPRLCSFVVTRLVIKKTLESDLHSVIIAIKMQGSKGMLRSNEILVQKNGLLDAELDITFSLQYSHHFKRDNNRLQIMLQRRKKYKNRTMLGFKTLAVGQVSMSHVLQHPMDREMNLLSCKDGNSETVARIVVLSLSTQPVDQDKLHIIKDRYRYDASDEDDLQDDCDISSNEGISDCETGEDNALPRQRTKANSLGNAFFNQQRNLKQKFISLIKKFKVTDEVLQSAVKEIGCHDRDRYADDDIFDDVESLTDSNPDMDAVSLQSVPKPKLKPFFDANKLLSTQDTPKINECELSALELGKKSEKQDGLPGRKNDKAAEMFGKKQLSEKSSSEFGQLGPAKKSTDRNLSVEVNLKKTLEKPSAELFSSSKKGEKISESVKKSEKTIEGRLAGDLLLSPKKNEKFPEAAGACKSETKKPEFDAQAFQEQLSTITSPEQSLPECIIFMNYMEPLCPILSSRIQSSKIHFINAMSHADIKAALNLIVNRVQKFMNTLPLMLKLAIIGSEAYMHSVVRPYVKLISARSSELISHVKFLIIPLGVSSMRQNLAHLDPKYGKLFNDCFWRELNFDSPDGMISDETTSRIMTYISEASYTVQLPFAEVVLTYKDKGIDDSSQMVVPFLGEIKLKQTDIGSDDDGMSNSPPQASFLDKLKEVTSHTINATPSGQQQSLTTVTSTPSSTLDFNTASPSEELELQMDYWLLPKQDHPAMGTSEKSIKKDPKVSLKTSFRSVQIFRPHLSGIGMHNPHLFNTPHSDVPLPNIYSGLSMTFVIRDKKQKIMRIGKKSKELEGLKTQQIDGISRLICTSKSQNQLLTVNIDGTDWTGIKFFQVASQWQTHFKHLPVLIFDVSSDNFS